MTDPSNPLGIKPLLEAQQETNPLIMIKKAGLGFFQLDWIFSTKLEKILLSACIIWATYCIFKLIIGLIT